MMKAAVDEKSLLWEVSGNGLEQPSYFFGTMHLMCAKDAVLTENVKRVIASVDMVLFEIDLGSMEDIYAQQISIKMPAETGLSTLLDDDEYQKVKLFFETHQPVVPMSMIEEQPPMMVSSWLYNLFLPCEDKIGIDARIVEEAQWMGKEIGGIETMEFQASLFDKIPYKQQAKELVKTIDEFEKMQQLFVEMLALYKSQDIEKLHELSTSKEGGIQPYTDILLNDRNRDWVDRFEELVAEKQCLFAIGTGHLGGADGVINLLRNKGYSLRPLENYE